MAEGYACKRASISEGRTHNQRRDTDIFNACLTSLSHSPDLDLSSNNSSVGINDITLNNMRPICRYFKKGTCQYGDRCRFSHCDTSKTLNVKEEHSASTSSDNNNSHKFNDTTSAGASVNEDWVNAPEFVPSASKSPKNKSYAEIVNPATDEEVSKDDLKMCPYMELNGVCNYSDGNCGYVHGDLCDLCGLPALHPFSIEKRKKHTQECIQQHERDMELSFAVARSKEKSCGVCFEVIMEKSSREQRFGILPNCNHCFCLTCIRKWRQARQFDNKIIRACPECRVTSDFVCPSMYWVDTKEEKEKLITDYKGALSRKDCKYFKQGHGKCPFGNKCFYLHALPDGTKRDVGPPPRQPRRQNHDGDIDVLQQIILWDFLDDRENNRWLYSIADDLEDLVAFFSDSEDSDWSDYDFFFD